MVWLSPAQRQVALAGIGNGSVSVSTSVCVCVRVCVCVCVCSTHPPSPVNQTFLLSWNQGQKGSHLFSTSIVQHPPARVAMLKLLQAPPSGPLLHIMLLHLRRAPALLALPQSAGLRCHYSIVMFYSFVS